MERAYSTDLTLVQLQSRLSASRAAREALGKDLSEALNHTRSLGHLGATWGSEQEEEDVLSTCLMGRLNPRVFPGTPQVWPESAAYYHASPTYLPSITSPSPAPTRCPFFSSPFDARG